MLITTIDPQPKLNSVKPGMITLSDLKAGESARVISLNGGRGFVSRMAALGFTPGAEVTVIQNSGWGPIIASVRDTRVALGRHEGQRTIVRTGTA